MLAAALHQRADLLQFRLRHLSFELQIELHPGQIQHVADEHLGVEPGIFHAFGRKEFGGLLDDLKEGEHEAGTPAGIQRSQDTRTVKVVPGRKSRR